MKLFHHATLILPDRLLENGAVLSSNGRIEAVGPADLPLHPASTIHHWVIRF